MNEIQPSSNGRFVKGNPGGPGNPQSATVKKWQFRLRKALTADLVEECVHKLAELMRGGSVEAIKVLLQYSVGKPRDAEGQQLHAIQVNVAYLDHKTADAEDD